LTLLASTAFAQQDGSRKWKFFLRGAGGPGYASMTTDIAGVDYEFSGFAGVADLALGVYVTDDLVLFGDFYGNVLSDPTLKRDNESVSTESFTLTASGFGVGVGYYLSPNSFWLSATLGAT
jgi:hypothetical protein